MTRTLSASGYRLLAQHDLGGNGDGMQVLRDGDALYVGHVGSSGAGTSILDVSDPARPELVDQWPAPAGTHTHKVQVADGLLLVNQERFGGGDPWTAGMVVYDVATDSLAPREVGRFDSGGLGVHRIVWTGGRRAHASATPDGFDDRIWIVLDLADPTHPVEAARFVLDEPQPEGARYAAHHALVAGDVAYLGYDDANLVVLDVSDWTAPRTIGRLRGSQAARRTRACRCRVVSSSSSPTSRRRTARAQRPGSSASSTSPTRLRRASSGSAPSRSGASTRSATARTTCTRTAPARSSASGSSSSPTSTPACASTTSATPARRARSRTGCPRRLRAAPRRRSTTSSSTPTGSSS